MVSTLQYEINTLKEVCLDQIGANIVAVFQTPGIDREMLSSILSLNSLNCNEIDLFDACISWARVKCQQDRKDSTKIENLRAALGDALFEIRFCSMTPKEFAIVGNEYPGLLEKQETMRTIRVIDSKGSYTKASKSRKTLNLLGEKCNLPPRQYKGAPKSRAQPSIECSLIKGSQFLFYSQTGDDTIEFSCDKAIDLKGFTLCNRLVDAIQIEIFVNERPKPCNYTIRHFDDKTKIEFQNNPIQIKEHQLCRIVVASEIFKKISIENNLHGFYLERSVLEDGALVRIPENTCNGITTIATIIFGVI